MARLSAATTRDLYVRRDPRCVGGELGTIADGQAFELLGNDGPWWYIRCAGVEGFINARYTRCKDDEPAPLWTTRVAMDGLRLRDRPGLRAAPLRALEQDDLLAVRGYLVAPGGEVWLQVERDGHVGYVAAARTCALPPAVPVTLAQTGWLRRLLLAARQSQRETTTPVSVTLAQAIVESHWGLSPLSAANNPLHVRATPSVDGGYTWGPIATGYLMAATPQWQHVHTVVVCEAFRTYRTLADGVRDHGLVLRTDPRFAAAYRSARDPALCASAIAEAGYATDPHYADKLITQIETLRLGQYDR